MHRAPPQPPLMARTSTSTSPWRQKVYLRRASDAQITSSRAPNSQPHSRPRETVVRETGNQGTFQNQPPPLRQPSYAALLAAISQPLQDKPLTAIPAVSPPPKDNANLVTSSIPLENDSPSPSSCPPSHHSHVAAPTSQLAPLPSLVTDDPFPPLQASKTLHSSQTVSPSQLRRETTQTTNPSTPRTQLFKPAGYSETTHSLQYFNPHDDGSVHVSEEEESEGEELWRSALIWYCLGKRPYYNFLNQAVRKVWSPKGGLQVIALEEDFFLFKLDLGEDLNRVLEKGVWLIGGRPLILRRWTPGLQVIKEPFSTLPLLARDCLSRGGRRQSLVNWPAQSENRCSWMT